jgi:serine/threonine protein kinase
VPSYDAKVDCWSAGVVAYELLTGKAPFSASSAAKILDAIRNRVLEYPSDLSEGARSFLSAALTRDPTRRATAKQLMQHPWIAACTAASNSMMSLSSYTATSSSTVVPAGMAMPVQAAGHVPAGIPMPVQAPAYVPAQLPMPVQVQAVGHPAMPVQAAGHLPAQLPMVAQVPMHQGGGVATAAAAAAPLLMK